MFPFMPYYYIDCNGDLWVPCTCPCNGNGGGGPGTFTLTYNANGGSNPPAPQTGGAITIRGAGTMLPPSAGITFRTWNTAANGSGSDVEPGVSLSLTANQTLYAQWNAAG